MRPNTFSRYRCPSPPITRYERMLRSLGGERFSDFRDSRRRWGDTLQMNTTNALRLIPSFPVVADEIRAAQFPRRVAAPDIEHLSFA